MAGTGDVPGVWRLVRYNDAAHLAGLPEASRGHETARMRRTG